ncbi:MAG TPA: M23 family metallopeptidase [Kofleriaceae bacterium]
MTLAETLGLVPFKQRLRETVMALRGDALTPASKFDLTSLRILQLALSYQLWRGRKPYGKRVPIYNLFNHRQTPETDGWSVRKTQVEDFRGRDLTYDSHNGTDFATPPGTVVVAPAAGRVAIVRSEFHRGGLKIMLDHGDGLCTTVGHLARALVRVGEEVATAQPIALSGASGLNFIGSLLADPPHVHMNVWLDGVPVDPFARPGETSIWRTHNEPTPNDSHEDHAPPSSFETDQVHATIDGCRDPVLQQRLFAIGDPWLRACETLFASNYFPTRFTTKPNLYRHRHARIDWLDLPFAASDYDGIELQ